MALIMFDHLLQGLLIEARQLRCAMEVKEEAIDPQVVEGGRPVRTEEAQGNGQRMLGITVSPTRIENTRVEAANRRRHGHALNPGCYPAAHLLDLGAHASEARLGIHREECRRALGIDAQENPRIYPHCLLSHSAT